MVFLSVKGFAIDVTLVKASSLMHPKDPNPDAYKTNISK